MMFLLPRKTAVRAVPKNKPDTITVLSQAQGFPCALYGILFGCRNTPGAALPLKGSS